MKISVIYFIEKSLATLIAMLVQLQSSHFLYKFHSNALLLGAGSFLTLGKVDIFLGSEQKKAQYLKFLLMK